MQKLATIEFEISKTDSKYLPYDFGDIFISKHYLKDYWQLSDDLTSLTGKELENYIPKLKKLIPYDKSLKIQCEFWGEWMQDYWGEWDANFELRKVKIL